jgi:hypothetical protein
MKKCKSCGTELPFTIRNGMRNYKHKYGYGIECKCLAKWSLSTKEGKEWLATQTAYKLKNNQKEKRKEQRKKDRRIKIELMSTSEYWSKIFQPKFNQLIREVDKACACIATGRTTGKPNAGHFYHAGHNKTLSINAHNIFLQSFESNHYQSGDVLKYEEGVIRTFGGDYMEFIKNLRKCPALHLTKIELMDSIKKVNQLIKKYRKENVTYAHPKIRMQRRNEINETLDLYPEEFSIYEPK